MPSNRNKISTWTRYIAQCIISMFSSLHYKNFFHQNKMKFIEKSIKRFPSFDVKLLNLQIAAKIFNRWFDFIVIISNYFSLTILEDCISLMNMIKKRLSEAMCLSHSSNVKITLNAFTFISLYRHSAHYHWYYLNAFNELIIIIWK